MEFVRVYDYDKKQFIKIKIYRINKNKKIILIF